MSDTSNSMEISANMFNVISPLFYISRIVGLAPFSISLCRYRYKVKYSIKYAIYSFCLGVILIVLAVFDISNMITGKIVITETTSEISSKYIMLVDVAAVQLTVITGIFGFPLRKRHFLNFISCINQIDLIIPITNIFSRKLSILTLLLVLIFETIFLGFDLFISKAYSCNKQYNQLLAYHVSYYIITFIVLQYSSMIYIIERRIARLNKYLLHTLSRVESSELSYVIHKENKNVSEEIKAANKMKEMTKVYLRICDGVNSINNCFGFIILIVILTCLIQLTVLLYAILSSIVKQINFMVVLTKSLWFILHFCRLVIVVEPCNSCLNQIRTLKTTLGKLRCSKYGDHNEEQLYILSNQISEFPIKFSAFGLGFIDRTLITSFAGAVATYLIVIIQFES